MTTSGLDKMMVEGENEDSFDEEGEEMSDGEEYEPLFSTSRAHQIKRLKAQARKLQDEHRQQADETCMLLDTQEVYKLWDDGPPGLRYERNRNRKTSQVLLALKSENVPKCMKWSYKHTFYTQSLENNREVFLARIELDDFEAAFDDKRSCPPIPKRFRNDRELMIRVCSKVSDALQYATNKLKNDQEVVLAAINNGKHTAPLAIQHASDKIRGMKKIVRVALNQEHGIRAVTFISPKLQQDKRMILQSIRHSSEECNRMYECLSELPETLREDDEIVLAALEKRGSNLRWVTCPHLLHDLDICLTACEQDGGAFSFVPEGPTKQQLLEDPEYLRMIVANGGFAALDKETAARVLSDKDLLMAAANSSTLYIQDLDQVFENDKELFLEILATNTNLYYSLPGVLQKNGDVASVCLDSESLTEEIASQVLRKNPNLQDNHQILAKMADSGFYDAIKRASVSLRDDKAIMLAACKAEGACFKLVSDRLRSDPEMISTALQAGCDMAVFMIPPAKFESNHALAVAAIRTYTGDELNRLRTHLPASVFTDREVLTEWCKREDWPYIGFINSEFIRRGNYQQDRQALLAIAKYRHSLLDLGVEEMLRDKNFLKACLAIEGRVLKDLERYDGQRRVSRWDFDLMLIAIAQSHTTLLDYCHGAGDHFDNLVDFSTKVRERLKVFDDFLTFLYGISNVEQHCAPAKRCRLPILDVGGGPDVKRLIAEFADTPLGTELQNLRSARENLGFWGY